MGIVTWLALGLISGLIATWLVERRPGGWVWDIVLGVVGAVIGGWLMSFTGDIGVTGFNLWSILVSVIGAIVVLALFHAFSGTWRLHH